LRVSSASGTVTRQACGQPDDPAQGHGYPVVMDGT
jgi:hypothetical protein